MSRCRWQRGLLVSVRDETEAEAAAAADVAIIDVKEPARGPLGRADPATAAAVTAAVAGRAAVTLACGELREGPASLARHVEDVLRRLPAEAVPPVAVKAGPAGLALDGWLAAFKELAATLPAGSEPVAVAYADWQAASAPAPDEILAAALAAGVATLLIDTFDKSGPGLLGVVTAAAVRDWSARARSGGLALAVAGRLAEADVIRLRDLGVAVVGVRTAACSGGRQGRVDATRVRRLARLFPSEEASPRRRRRGHPA